ncbi:MAG: Holliday junction resolvase RuvX [Actinomycetota bacterium]
MTVLAVDPGSRRIGVAISDPDGKVGFPLDVLQRSGDWLGRLAELVRERDVGEVLVGLPRRLDGSEGPAAEQARALAAALASAIPVPVRLVDERMTTAAADRALAAAGVRSRRRRRVVDGSAAALLLQSYLDTSPRRGGI